MWQAAGLSACPGGDKPRRSHRLPSQPPPTNPTRQLTTAQSALGGLRPLCYGARLPVPRSGPARCREANAYGRRTDAGTLPAGAVPCRLPACRPTPARQRQGLLQGGAADQRLGRLHPRRDARRKRARRLGTIHEDGTYALNTNDAVGAGPGWYRITVAAFPVAAPKTPPNAFQPMPILPEKYRDPELSLLRCQIKPNQVNTIDLNLD